MGTHRRIDYVLASPTLPVAHRIHRDQAQVLTNISDHIPVSAIIQLRTITSPNTHCNAITKPRLNPAALTDSGFRQRLFHLLARIPHAPWDATPNHH